MEPGGGSMSWDYVKQVNAKIQPSASAKLDYFIKYNYYNIY